MAAQSSVLAWRIPWTEEPGGLPSMGLRRVRRDWATKWRQKQHDDLYPPLQCVTKQSLNTPVLCLCVPPSHSLATTGLLTVSTQAHLVLLPFGFFFFAAIVYLTNWRFVLTLCWARLWHRFSSSVYSLLVSVLHFDDLTVFQTFPLLYSYGDLWFFFFFGCICSMQDVSFLTRERTHAPCIGTTRPNHWITSGPPIRTLIDVTVIIALGLHNLGPYKTQNLVGQCCVSSDCPLTSSSPIPSLSPWASLFPVTQQDWN